MTEKQVLIWMGGDVSGYELVTYRLGDKRGTSFLAAAALRALYNGNIDRLIVIVPETLFEDSHCKNYKLLLEAKSGYRGLRLAKRAPRGERDVTIVDSSVYELLEHGIECVTTPHPGVAGPLRLNRGEDKVLVEYGESRESHGTFNSLVNKVYLTFRQLVLEDYNMVIDLTHGTNPLVSGALLASSMIAAVYEIPIRIYMAPIMGRPSRDTVVEFIDMTEASSMVNTIASGINAWKLMDERLLPIDDIARLGRSLGPRYKKTYGDLKKAVEGSGNLLWTLRSGQIPLVPSSTATLRDTLSRAKNSFDEIVRDESAVREDTAWIPLADAAITLTSRIVHELQATRNIDVMIAALKKLASSGMPDRVLGPARELAVVAVLAANMGEGTYRVGDQAWEGADRLLRECAGQRRECNISDEDCRRLGLDPEMLGDFERIRQIRNRLMHGRISRDDGAVIEVGKDDIKVKLGSDVISSGDISSITGGMLSFIESLIRPKKEC
ncbi:MAG: hypothetical protein F7C08_03205 [Desulfurococcales archaeon]|nr:hypothetical protein [Desulfurococcales archaeon]MCE4605520.1 hypothetical protein [Desulfurococcales archaeon]